MMNISLFEFRDKALLFGVVIMFVVFILFYFV